MVCRFPVLVLAGWSLAVPAVHAQSADSLASSSPDLTNSEVAAAIALGQSSNGPFGYFAMSGTTLEVLAIGPVGRIAAAAAKAKRMYLSFTPESVSTELRAPLLAVSANPRPFQGRIEFEVERVLIRGRATGGHDSVLVQPLRVERRSTTWTNRFGARIEAQGLIAYFNTSVLSLEDMVIVVVTNLGEAKFKVKKKDRDRLR